MNEFKVGDIIEFRPSHFDGLSNIGFIKNSGIDEFIVLWDDSDIDWFHDSKFLNDTSTLVSSIFREE